MSEVIEVKRREVTGKKRIRRLRATGVVPAVLYGHGQETMSLVVPLAQVVTTLRHGHRLVELQGDVKDKAFIREVQWDTYGIDVLHVDFFRVSETDKLRVTVPLELKGEAPGTKEGGIVEVVQHEIDIECPVAVLPDKLIVNISQLKLGGAIMTRDIPLPPGAKLLSSADVTLVHCIRPKTEEELTAAIAGTAVEPEVITRKKEVEGAEGEEEKKK